VRIRLIVHCGCALERCVMRSPLDFSGRREEIDTQKYKAIQNAAKRFEKSLNLRLDADELALMSQMV
jgi:transcriptional regulatory protein LevR